MIKKTHFPVTQASGDKGENIRVSRSNCLFFQGDGLFLVMITRLDQLPEGLAPPAAIRFILAGCPERGVLKQNKVSQGLPNTTSA